MNDDKNILHIPIPKTIVPSRLKDYGLWPLTMFNYSPEIQLSRKSFFELCPRRSFAFYAIAHMHGGYGHFWMPGFESDIKPGDLILLTPGTLNRYGGYNGRNFLEDNISFFGPAADMMQKAGIIKSGLYHIGQVRQLRVIQEYLKEPSADSQFRGVLELQKFLMELYLNRKTNSGKNPALEVVLESIRENPKKWWTVHELAEICHVTADHLRRLFLAKTGMSPKHYIDRTKLMQAGHMLINTEISIKGLAEYFGYMDPYHFSRRFKDLFGISPLNYRKQHKSETDIF